MAVRQHRKQVLHSSHHHHNRPPNLAACPSQSGLIGGRHCPGARVPPVEQVALVCLQPHQVPPSLQACRMHQGCAVPSAQYQSLSTPACDHRWSQPWVAQVRLETAPIEL